MTQAPKEESKTTVDLFKVTKASDLGKLDSSHYRKPEHFWVCDWSDICDKSFKIDPNKKQPIDKDGKKDGFLLPTLSPKECTELIRRSEILKYKDCGYPVNYRSNTRVMTHDPALAKIIFERIKSYFPQKITHGYSKRVYDIHSCNPRFRFCKYITGQHFDRHCDAHFDDYDNNLCSFFTVNIYLNDKSNFEGGETKFWDKNRDRKSVDDPLWIETFAVKAYAGLGLMFDHTRRAYYHNGERLKSGLKYLVRTDMVYSSQKYEDGLLDELFS